MIEAINAGRVPPPFQEDLQSRANELVNTVNCPPPDQNRSDDENSKKEEKKTKKKKEDEEQPDDELVPTEPVPTVTEGDG